MNQMSDAIHTASSAEAFATAKRNALRRYPSPKHDGARLYPLVSPAVSPQFSVSAQDSIFAIGSCFARNLEGALHAAGMNVLSRDPDLGPIGENVGAASNYLNKYTAASILNDLKWALERDSFPGEKIIYPVDENTFCDPQLGLVRLPYPLPEIMDMRERYLNVMAQAIDADVVIITLGYVETWYDKELDLYLNIAPPPKLCKAQPDRFEFRVLGFNDVLQALNEIYALLKKHRTKPLKILLTVSPVPLISTFRDVDILVANTYSKSVQRAAAETFVSDKSDVDYFPSYETVTLSNPEVSWSRGDYRHVSPDVVARIMSNVLVSYAPDMEVSGVHQGRAMTDGAVMATARMLIKLNEADELAELFCANRAIFSAHEALLSEVSSALQRGGKLTEAADAVHELVERAPERPVLLQQLISIVAQDPENHQKTRALLATHAKRFPGREVFRKRVARSLKPEIQVDQPSD
jgi:hypothetical protein